MTRLPRVWTLERTILILGPMGALLGVLTAARDPYYSSIPAGAGYYAIVAIIAGALTRWNYGGWKNPFLAGMGVGMLASLGAPWEYLITSDEVSEHTRHEWFATYASFIPGWTFMGALMGLVGAGLARGVIQRYGAESTDGSQT